jgi:hypothetical protein
MQRELHSTKTNKNRRECRLVEFDKGFGSLQRLRFLTELP